ncbi:unnamed protein product [Linum tenue]|uniref:Uncharacterized protein n=1 Tax=Linum tenue TaxID=586396 RepID=A0AAV0I8I2_9ROSI|nr:unnamed protein product [Linum tenue]
MTTLALLLLLLLLLFLHSLRRRSVPKTAATTGKPIQTPRPPEPPGALPLIGHIHLLAGSKDPACRILGAMTDRYGPVFSLKFGIHDLLVVSGSEIVKDCLTTNDRTLATRAGIPAGKYMGYDHAVFAVAPYGAYWRRVSKMATLQLLSSHRIGKLAGVRLSELGHFVRELYGRSRDGGLESANKSVNISEMLERLTFNTSLRMLVGKRFAEGAYAAEDGDARRYKEAVEEAVRLSGVFVASDALPWLEWLDLGGHVAAMKRSAKVIDEVVGKWLEEHDRSEEGGDVDGDSDFMDVMLSSLADDAGDDASLSGHSTETIIKATTLKFQIIMQTLTLTSSGSTSITVTWALSLLLNHPQAQKTAQHELDIHVGRTRWVQESDIPNLPYLRAIIKETLRLYPPGPLTGIREAMEDCTIGGYRVSKGTRVVINIWKLHRDPKVWGDPASFRPERFLTRHADVDVRPAAGQSSFEYLPFSYGRRSCPAVNLGMRVVQLILARVIQGFDLATADGLAVDMAEGQGVALPKVKALEVVAAPRMGSEMYSFC